MPVSNLGYTCPRCTGNFCSKGTRESCFEEHDCPSRTITQPYLQAIQGPQRFEIGDSDEPARYSAKLHTEDDFPTELKFSREQQTFRPYCKVCHRDFIDGDAITACANCDAMVHTDCLNAHLVEHEQDLLELSRAVPKLSLIHI